MGSLVFRIAGSGGGGVTAADNLIHWWKLTENPSSGSATDYGTSGSASTNLTVVEATTTTGPSALDSPTVFRFDGSNDVAKTQIINGSGTKNSIANLMETNYYTMSYWIKDDGVDSSEFFWSTGNYFGSGRLQGGGQGMWQYYNQVEIIFGNSSHYVRTAGATSWKHHAIVCDTRASNASAAHIGISYVDGVANPDGTVNNGYPHYSGYAEGVTDYWFSIGALVWNSSTTSLFGEFAMCDFRMYDRPLTSTEVSAIAAGDW